MRAKPFYLMLMSILSLFVVLALHGLYEDNFLKGNTTYIASITEKYINGNQDGGAYVLKLKFKWKDDSIIDEGTVGKEDYEHFKINDTMSIYYNPNATTTRIIFANSLNSSNKGTLLFTLVSFILIIFSVYKYRSVSEDAIIE